MLTRDQWTLYVLSLAEGGTFKPVQLQKTLFLLSKNLPGDLIDGDFYDFQPYSYGPYDATVYQDTRNLAAKGLARVTPDETQRYSEYSASPDGVAAGQALAAQVPEVWQEYVSAIVKWTRSLDFAALVRAIYSKYPEMAANSVFRELR